MSETIALLTDAVTRMFGDLVTREVVESAEQGTWPDPLWRAIEQSGLASPPEVEAGESGGTSWLEAHVVIRASGRFAAPVPLAETIIAASLLARTGLEVPSGPMTVAPVLPNGELRLERRGREWRAHGTVSRVPWGSAVAHLVAVANAAGAPMLALLHNGEATISEDRNLALEPRDTLVFEDSPVVAAAPAPGFAGTLRTYGAMARAAQMAGALESCLDQAVRYATERKQFGRVIGNFQVIQHYLAVAAAHVAAASLAAEQAFRAADRGDNRFETAVAKVRVGEAAGVCAGLVHQVHGAIGFTYEHALHFSTRRLWSWRSEFGAESDWALELGRSVAARGPEALWSDLTAR